MKPKTRDPGPEIETRNVILPVELREAGPGSGANRLVGYAAKFGVESCPLADCWGEGRFTEVIRAGAFRRTLGENPDIRALYNHDTSVVLGRTRSGTLRLAEDEVGLRFEVDLPDTQAARDIKAMIARGDIDGCSFGFMTVEDEVLKRADDSVLRTLIDVELFEISPAVAFPAYEDTEVALRARGLARSSGRRRLEMARRRLILTDLS